ncbi:hypothetical protein [Runella sp.]|uniref:TapB family protein n=1 Tax=Runella sp. TaxID=1960881 RepID=UPI003D0E712C
MMKKYALISLLLITVVISTRIQAQKCLGISVKSGMGYEMATYNGKDKLTGKILYNIKEVNTENGATVMSIEMQSFDAKDKLQTTNAYKCSCKGNELMVDMTSMLAGQENPLFKDAQMTFSSTDLIYSDSYTVGAALKDASLKGQGTMGGGMNLTYEMLMSNRKVAGQETITTPAGTFNAFKITSDMKVSTKTIMNISFDFQAVSFRAPNVLWDVRSETYRKDKLMAYSILTKIF